MTKTNPNDSQNKHSKVSTFQVCTLLPLLRFFILHWVSVQRLLSYRGEWHGRYFLVVIASLSVRERDLHSQSKEVFFFFSLLKNLETQDLPFPKMFTLKAVLECAFVLFFLNASSLLNLFAWNKEGLVLNDIYFPLPFLDQTPVLHEFKKTFQVSLNRQTYQSDQKQSRSVQVVHVTIANSGICLKQFKSLS